ncbi:OmpA family protein [Pedobacter sp. HMF7056]|uniref:OmpA family protein n=1 Tax=Hufsiella ginkgonis TaxID=2695274 RepID=A0A7K1Y3Q6_9SPHI|nr:OmpA family protein [Hufsiella ginkgonis]
MVNPARSQYVVDYQRVADTYFQHKEYYAAAQYYQKALDLIPSPTTETAVPFGKAPSGKMQRKRSDYEKIIFRLAESLRLYKDYLNAEKWYAIAKGFSDKQYQSAAFWHPVCLRANQKFREALSGFGQYLASSPADDNLKKRANLEIADCRFAIRELDYPRLYRLTKLAGRLNSAGSNYAPVWINNQLYFTSSRPIDVDGKKEYLSSDEDSKVRIAKKESPYVNAIYQLSGEPSQATNEVKKLTLLKDMEQAAPTFNPAGNRMYFTAWQNKGEKDKHAIYTSQRDDKGEWSAPVIAGGMVNAAGFNSIQPCLTKDGRYLVFSSDRPGGFGKYDLWYAPVNGDGTFGHPLNMGAAVNTAEDEEAASWLSAVGKLVFSSNGRTGMGGFDFYETTGSFATNTWKSPVNKGNPFNSSKDDMYFTATDDAGNAGFISSDRESLCCLELFKIEQTSLAVSGQLTDCVTGKPLQGVTVRLTDSLDKTELGKMVTAQNGTYHFALTTRRPLLMVASKTKYFSKSIFIDPVHNATDTLVNPSICLDTYQVNKPVIVKDVYYEFDKSELTASSKTVLDKLVKTMADNPNIRVEIGAHTDNKGTEAYNLELSLRRAESCVQYLVSQGIDAERLTSRGYGESMPIAPNTLDNGKDNPDGRSKNRRTEFKVTRDDILSAKGG